jgi:putative ABC transport system permease protein
MAGWIENAFHDLRFAIRGWRKSLGFVAAVIATLALGIGANTAIFSAVSGVLLRPLPLADPGRLVRLYESHPDDRLMSRTDGPPIWADLVEWRTHSNLLEGAVTYTSSSRTLTGAGEPAQVAIVNAERGLFPLLGVAAMRGRTFTDGDAANVAVSSYGFWLAQFGGDPSAIGRSVTLDGQPFTLIGVMPPEFEFPGGARSAEMWVPWDAAAALRPRPSGRLDAVIARMKPGVTVEALRQELSAMQGPSKAGRVVLPRPLHEVVAGESRQSLMVLMGAVGMLLLVACVNVANLLLARTAARGREIAVRAALGAGGRRLIRQFLVESLALAVAGGVAGLAVGVWGSRILAAMAAGQLPRAEGIGVDWRVLLFVSAVCVIAGISFGLTPAMAAARGGERALKTARVTSAPRDTLVVVEVALAFVLLAGAGLLARTFLNLQRTGPGFDATPVLTAHVVVAGGPEAVAIEDRVERIPGVRAAGLISLLPLQNSGWSGGISIEGAPAVPVELRYVTPGYFRAMGVPIRRGRGFSREDRPGGPRVIVVNEAFARQYLGDRDPVGRSTDRGVIIGVAGDVRQEALSLPPAPEVFYTVEQNFAQLRRHGSTLVVRAPAATGGLAAAVRAAVREVNPGLAVFQVAAMREVVDASLARHRLYAFLIGLFAVTGAALAAAGIYGVIAYLVALRTREFGVRMALGARAGGIMGLVMGRGARLAALGLALGLAGAFGLTRVLGGVLYGVGATDPATLLATAAVLLAAALAACLAPAARAARVDPASALRCE